MIKRTFRILAYLLGGLTAVLAVCVALVAWRLSQGPVSLAFLTPTVERILSDPRQPFAIRLGDTVLTWAGWERALDIRFVDVSAIGSDGAVIEARDRLAAQGIHMDYLRIRAFPFTQEVVGFLRSHDTNFVVEQNRDGQMKALLMLEANDIADRLVSIRHYNGLPIPSACVVQGVIAHVQKETAA